MIKIETFSIARGNPFSVFLFAEKLNSIEAYFFNPFTKEYTSMKYTSIDEKPQLKKINFEAPKKDGFFLCRVNGKPIAKRVGAFFRYVVVSYSKNSIYELPYKLWDWNGEVSKEGILEYIVSGFYFTKFGEKDIILEYNNKKIPLSRPDFRTDYVIIQKSDGNLNSSIGEVILPDVTLPDVSLPNSEIKDVKIEATMPDWEIK